MKLTVVLSLVLCFLLYLPLSAQNKHNEDKVGATESTLSIPSTMSYQGVLTDNNGIPVPDGSYSMTFTLWTDSISGSKVWPSGSGETHNVQITDGIFNVQMGVSNPLTNIAFGNQYWLQVIVSGTSLGRIRLSSSAYSFNTARIQGQPISPVPPTLMGQVLKWTGSVWAPGTDQVGGGVQSVTASSPISSSGGTDPNISLNSSGITSTYLADEAVTTEKIDDNAVTDDKLSWPISQTAFYVGSILDIVNTSGSGNPTAIEGRVTATGSGNTPIGVFGNSQSTSGAGVGVFGYSQATNGIGVWGFNTVGSNGYGVYYQGGLGGTGLKSFQMDHPLDPANKYLYHFSAEGPEPYLIYRGNVILDGNGEVSVELPDYFDAINRDFHYQLTPIGSAADIYIADEIENNRFCIAGGKPGMKVSWTVTGIRNDPYVRHNPPSDIHEKPIEFKGKYLNPEFYGQPSSMGQFYQVLKRAEEEAAAKTANSGN